MAKNIGLYTKKLNYAKRETEGVNDEQNVKMMCENLQNGNKTR